MIVLASGQRAHNQPNLNPATAVGSITVGGNILENITLESEYVGDYNVIYQIHTEQGAVVNLAARS